ncbi:hypothetical protein cand_014470 [Cryptosporidium andersoni]|uniref:Importin N-terminal domain-containing protein n=1 Tax=Cryptosporidium andersoni TaxID=117008 RepID=A0A1J4MU77_9CRYT|nr:hypothetical protein cand_014470 [Cryptosporidium andersoni]
MQFTSELVSSKVLQLWGSNDFSARSEANRYLMEFQESPLAWNVSQELLENSRELEVQYTAAQTLCYKVSHNLNEFETCGGSISTIKESYFNFICKYLQSNTGDNTIILLSKISEGFSYLIVYDLTKGNCSEDFEKCLRISEPFFLNKGTGIELWITLNIMRYMPDACKKFEAQEQLIFQLLSRILSFLSESLICCISSQTFLNNHNMKHKLLDLLIDILIEYFEKLEAPLFRHLTLSQSISQLMQADICIAPYRMAELFVRGLPRCSYYMQKIIPLGNPGSICKTYEDNQTLNFDVEFPYEGETLIIKSLLIYLRSLFDKLRNIPLASEKTSMVSIDEFHQMIRMKTWSGLKMEIPQIQLDNETERSILSWSGVIFNLLEGYSQLFILDETSTQNSGLNINNPLTFLPKMLSLLLSLHIRIPGVLANIWCTLRDLVNENILSHSQGVQLASSLVTPAIHSITIQCRDDYYYWEQLGITRDSIILYKQRNIGHDELKSTEQEDDSAIDEYCNFLDTANIHIGDIYFFLSSLGSNYASEFITFIYHSLMECCREDDSTGCIVFLRFADSLIESTNSLQGPMSNIIEFSCISIPKTQSCIYQVVLLLQKAAFLLSDKSFQNIWFTSLKYLLDVSECCNLTLISSTFEEICQFGADHILNSLHSDQILLELSERVILIIQHKIKFCSNESIYSNLSKIDENIGLVGGIVHCICYTMINSNKSIEDIAKILQAFLFHLVKKTLYPDTIHISTQLTSSDIPNSYNLNTEEPILNGIWTLYVLYKILKIFTLLFCSSETDTNLASISQKVLRTPSQQLILFLQAIFSNSKQFGNFEYNIGHLILNSISLPSESQGYGVIIFASILQQHSRNIPLRQLMFTNKRNFLKENPNCLLCLNDIIIAISCLILRIISDSWSVEQDQDPSNISVEKSWFHWNSVYYKFVRQHLVDIKEMEQNPITLIKKHGACTIIVCSILKKLPQIKREEFINSMKNDYTEIMLYEFWIRKAQTIKNIEIYRIIEPLFQWQITYIGNSHILSNSAQSIISSPYLNSCLSIALQALESKDKFLINTVLTYLSRLCTIIHISGKYPNAWKVHFSSIIVVLFSNYPYFHKNLIIQTCRLVSSLLECFPDDFLEIINRIIFPDINNNQVDNRTNPFRYTSREQNKIITRCFQNLRGAKLRQLLIDISNIVNGTIDAKDCLLPYELYLQNMNQGNTSIISII